MAQGSSKSATTVTSKGAPLESAGAASLTEGWQAAARNDAPIRKDNLDMMQSSIYICPSQLVGEGAMCKTLAYESFRGYTANILTL
jgi:hypothetical protein